MSLEVDAEELKSLSTDTKEGEAAAAVVEFADGNTLDRILFTAERTYGKTLYLSVRAVLL